MNNPEILVDLEDVKLCIADRTLIQNFSLQLKRGMRIGLTGPSGCGKTTLLRSITSRRLLSCSTAKRFEVKDYRVGYIPQQGGLLPWYSLKRNLKIFASQDDQELDSRYEDILARFELTHAGETFPEELSGGERQRARLACAISAKPVLFCADEPLTEVGLEQRWRLLTEWSTEMIKYQTSLLIISHDIDTLIYLCDEIIILGGLSEQPATIVNRVKVLADPHPRDPADLYSSSLGSIRNKMYDELFLKPTFNRKIISK